MKITWKEGEALDLSRLTNKKNKSEHTQNKQSKTGLILPEQSGFGTILFIILNS